MSSDLGVLGNRPDSTLHSQSDVKVSLLGITPGAQPAKAGTGFASSCAIKKKTGD